MSLTKNVRIARVASAAAAGQTAVNGSLIDMAGFDGVLFIALLGTVAATSTVGLHAEQNDVNSATGVQELQGSATIAVGATNSNTAVVLDVHKPRQRYVRPVIKRGVADTVVDGVIAILYDARSKPTDHDVTVLASALLPDADTV